MALRPRARTAISPACRRYSIRTRVGASSWWAQDRATPAVAQRAAAARAGRVAELPAGHHPFLSRPELLAAELAAAVT